MCRGSFANRKQIFRGNKSSETPFTHERQAVRLTRCFKISSPKLFCTCPNLFPRADVEVKSTCLTALFMLYRAWINFIGIVCLHLFAINITLKFEIYNLYLLFQVLQSKSTTQIEMDLNCVKYAQIYIIRFNFFNKNGEKHGKVFIFYNPILRKDDSLLIISSLLGYVNDDIYAFMWKHYNWNIIHCIYLHFVFTTLKIKLSDVVLIYFSDLIVRSKIFYLVS